MDNIRLVYSKKTKHSKKIAKAVAKSLNIKAESIRFKPAINEANMLFIVGGIYNNQDSTDLIKFINSLNSRVIHAAALITSSNSGDLAQNNIRNILNQMGIEIVGEFVCCGSSGLIKFGHPNSEDLDRAIAFAKALTTEKDKKKQKQ